MAWPAGAKRVGRATEGALMSTFVVLAIALSLVLFGLRSLRGSGSGHPPRRPPLRMKVVIP
jgi:hypothetical protein